MQSITVSLSEERAAQLQQQASQAGLTAEEFLRRCVEQLLDQAEPAFERAAAYVLKKNTELYRRLS